ncbi:MAG TPA: type II toxin-antitoxin system HicB family antitoxin [Chloroflexota bacterium]|nr:type II toxin-antitoxin system HicB family antitoxin [Chloroflexota bacterium]
MTRCTVLLIPDVDDGGYTARVPALPGCITEGDTLSETLDNVRDAIRVYLEDVKACGEPVPEELARPVLEEVEV